MEKTKRIALTRGFPIKALALPVVLGMALAVPSAASAGTATIWGEQTPAGKLRIEKIDLPKQATITGYHLGPLVENFCIWAGTTYPNVIYCWTEGDPSPVGRTLPAGKGYYAIPRKPSLNSGATVEIEVSF